MSYRNGRAWRIPAICFLISITFIQCPQPGRSKFAWIAARSGLRLRKTPDLNGKKIGLVPFNSRVEILEEAGESRTIDGKKGQWTRIRWRQLKGWVFGGYLARRDQRGEMQNPAETQPPESRGLHVLSEISSEWREVQESKEGYYFFAPCFAGIRSVTFDRKNPEQPRLVFFLGQDAELLTVRDVESRRENGEKIYRLTVSNSLQATPRDYQVEFHEHPGDARIGFWSNLQNSGQSLTVADARHADSFPLRKEKDGDCGEP